MTHPSRKPSRARAAFTMADLLIVITIIVILTTILIPVVSKVTRSARQANVKAQIAHLAQVLRIECDHRITGSIRLTRSEEETEDLRGSLPELRHDGFPMREVALADVLPEASRARFHAAFEVPEDGVVHPVRFIHGLAAEAVKRGARVHERSRVTGARWHDGSWEVLANDRRVRQCLGRTAGDACLRRRRPDHRSRLHIRPVRPNHDGTQRRYRPARRSDDRRDVLRERPSK